MDYNKHNTVPRILIIDDVEVNRFVLRDIITDMRCMPMLAENGMQGLKIVEKCHPQLILLDIAMPEMDGFEVCRIIKDNPLTRDIPIVFISAFDEAHEVVKGFALGGTDYITKPFIPEVVVARLKLHLQLYDTNRELLDINRKLQVSINEQLKQIEEEKKKVLYALLRVVKENACYDESHMDRIRYNCRMLAQAMQLSPLYEHIISDVYIDTIELAAPLCDLGNIAIPTDVLQKSSALTSEEMELMKTHTVVGYKILSDVKSTGDYNDFIQMSMDIAYYHHENWNGSGYPCGKQGTDIPLAAQIVAIISTYCALTEERSYRPSFSREDALNIIEKDVGVKFNPDIFKILSKIFKRLT